MTVSTSYDYSVSTVQQREAEAKSAAYGTSSTDFLQLLIVQLTNQDPLNPMEDTDFTSQLAQLQALEEQMTMTKSINAMRMDNQVQSGTAMIGKEVTGYDKNGNEASGTVVRVVQTSDDIYVELGNGQQIPVTSVIDIRGGDDSLAGELSSAAACIGMFVEAGYDSAMQPIQGIVESVGVENGSVVLQLYGGKSLTWDQITSMRAPLESESWYVLPDEVREKVEAAQAMLGKTVTGTSTAGQSVTGIVANAQLDDDGDVYLILFDGTLINIDDVVGKASEPTAEDARRDLGGLWVVGLDEDGNTVEGLVVDAEDRSDGLALILSNGGHVYYDTLQEITEPEDEESGEGDTVETVDESAESGETDAAENSGAAGQNDGAGDSGATEGV